ncbi:hypothetical protein IE53DRAFT_388549 [Violaceomyces palustris]|uniref:Uncharacterized protein n=1 Tax=Violaceomyces palustris TaxID=1673888 RepID=A0ACD0NTY0_9BASI|nr:hypothetical protein IE53DRAFT_388549 [Violaceomyces palustris]
MSSLPTLSATRLSAYRTPTTLPRLSQPPASSSRLLHASAPNCAKPRKQRNAADPMALKKMPKFDFDDVPTLGHMLLQRRREMLQFYRTIEFEIPKLAAFREEYKPPTQESFLRFKFQHYQGEPHPASRKVVLSFNIADLFKSGALQSEKAQHKLLLIAGERYRADQGKIVISCETLPSERQNMKWCSDTLDKMIAEANSPQPDLSAIPLDPRPTLVREAKKRSYQRKDGPSIKDFPKEWL